MDSKDSSREDLLQRVLEDRAESSVVDPALGLLTYDKWSDAFGALHCATFPADQWISAERGQRRQDLLDALGGPRTVMKRAIETLVDELFSEGSPDSGRLALAWLMLTCDPRQPASFHRALPQLQHILDNAEGLDPDAEELLQRRIKIWWRACEGEWSGKGAPSVFAIAANETRHEPDDETELGRILSGPARRMLREADAGPSIVVMPKATRKFKPEHSAYKEMAGERIPLVVAKDVAGIRAQLHREHPHAGKAVDLLMRDLREGRPVRLKPMILVGSPGCSKSRLIRRLADLLSLGVYRFDGGSSQDGVGYGGTPRGWSDSTPCAPVRAVQQFGRANPIVMVDEIDKAASSHTNGALVHVLLSHTDRETSARFRDVALDMELDLSWVSHLATANTVDTLPAPLRDRYRIIRVPTPTLAHLPALAAQVMADLARDDEERRYDASFAYDELDNMGRIWAAQRFSMRALQKIVQATLEARDECAMRH